MLETLSENLSSATNGDPEFEETSARSSSKSIRNFRAFQESPWHVLVSSLLQNDHIYTYIYIILG